MKHLRSVAFTLGLAGLLTLVGACNLDTQPVGRTNPFDDLPVIPIDGETRELSESVVPMGMIEAGAVVRALVEGDRIESVMILTDDEQVAGAGVVVGGGAPNRAIDFRAPKTGRYFLFVEFEADARSFVRRASVTLSEGDPAYQPPATQSVVVSFGDGFLSDPGLFDPESGNDAERELLESISPQVREGIVERLRTLFSGTPIVIVDENEGVPDGLFSVVTLVPERKIADATDLVIDSVIPIGLDDVCSERVVFGELLPVGATEDIGNQVLDDAGIVYVGSFQGRGLSCRTAATDSVNNIVLGLSQTAAHEIGHLVGLQHVALVDIMDRSPSRAFQRELRFGRGQILSESLVENGDGTSDLVTTVLTTVIQDADRYFEGIFRN
jgi:hypothetical protein